MAGRGKSSEPRRYGHRLAWLVLSGAIVLPLAFAAYRILAADRGSDPADDRSLALALLAASAGLLALILGVLVRYSPRSVSAFVWALAILLAWGVGSVWYVVVFEAR
jgi:hypothetical protein